MLLTHTNGDTSYHHTVLNEHISNPLLCLIVQTEPSEALILTAGFLPVPGLELSRFSAMVFVLLQLKGPQFEPR